MDYPIQVAARRAGLTPVTLRAWERRYEGIAPHRDQRGRRRYSEELVEKLSLLSALVKRGYRIGEIAPLESSRLRELFEQLSVDETGVATVSGGQAGPGAPRVNGRGFAEPRALDAHIAESVEAVRRLDDIALHLALEDATLIYGRLDIVDDFMFPLIHRVEALVEAGELEGVHVGFLKTALRSALASLFMPREEDADRPVVVIAGPVSAHHDIGLVASAIHAYAAGWHPIVLGSGIPAEQIVQAAHATNARAVVMSFVSKRYDLGAWEELTRAQRALGNGIPVYFGGRMPEQLVRDLVDAGLHHLQDMDELRATLAAQPG
jgi:DNA-binding transcriptional MerR regulator/methylmalonyl-CoA mutase cobalamin-binding subunit